MPFSYLVQGTNIKHNCCSSLDGQTCQPWMKTVNHCDNSKNFHKLIFNLTFLPVIMCIIDCFCCCRFNYIPWCSYCTSVVKPSYVRRGQNLFSEGQLPVPRLQWSFTEDKTSLQVHCCWPTPWESTAPYHSITLPETFHLDDFELPEAAFQG